MVEEEVQKLKEEVMSMFIIVQNPSQKLSLIDSIQRLGLSYHFEKEISEILHHMQKPSVVDNDENIYEAALRFRLLRQQGYAIPTEIFNKFTNEDEDFEESIVKGKREIMSLYEASHWRMKGEIILDRALAFTTTKLEEMAMDVSCPFRDEAAYALKWPILKALPRLIIKRHISIYEKDPLKNNVLLKFAKLDYNSMQKLYQKELCEVSRWWKHLNLLEELSFARDRMVESYIWALGVYYEPKYSLGRIILAKIVALATVLDDMYDLYATLDELQLFTQAIERWDMNCIVKLPKYMKIFYGVILKVYEEIEKDINKDNVTIPYAIHYAKEGMKRQCRAYFAEAKWFHEGYVPTFEEYMKVATVSTCYYLFVPISFVGMGVAASKEAFEWVESDPMLLKASGIIGRLMNDVTSHTRGDVGSAVECHMKQHGLSEEETLVELENEVIKAWRDITEDYIKTTNISNEILLRVLNLARLSDLFYKEEDGYTFVDKTTKHFIASIIVEPLPT
ncbi:(-)-germacrene D synthase-like [Cucumis melo var. makuwa]|uniref:(-)-germacrene D synthase-like n=1 Tax=Cucumis melo var. makuwa TaxID=1194695 RepID=A0A5D3D784_CUCMM|nr:(-)-germacrene D synthase-like [Cucumis melo var. makuwa]